MNNYFKYVFYSCVYIIANTFFASAQTTPPQKLIHYWDFNSTLPCAGGGGVANPYIPADYSLIGHAVIIYNNAGTTGESCGCYQNAVAPFGNPIRDSILDNGTPGAGTVNLQIGYATDAGCGGSSAVDKFVRTRNPSHNMQFLWYIPTTGFSNIKIDYAAQTSSTGSGQAIQYYSYSLDSGLTFTTAGLIVDSFYIANSAYGNAYVSGFSPAPTIDLSGIPAVNNNPKLVFRIMYGDSGSLYQNGTVGDYTGNNRYDNITIHGDSICPSFTTQPLSQKVCGMSNVNLIVSVGSLNPSTAYTLQWYENRGSGFVALSNGGVYSGAVSKSLTGNNYDTLTLTGVTAAMNNYQYRCEIIPVGGCGNVFSNTALLNVESPNISANFISGNGTVCAGTKVTLYGSGGQKYVWSGGITNNTAFAAPASNQTYTVIGTDVSGCTNSATAMVNVYTPPSVQAFASSQNLCSGNSVILYGTGAKTYSWSGSVTDSVSFIPKVIGTTTYSVTGTDANGCTATSTIAITVSTMPTLTASSTASSICQGDSIALNANVSTGTATYSWSGGVSDGVKFIPPAGTLTYTVTGTASDLCVATASVTVTVNAKPMINANATSLSICEDDNVTLYGSGAGTSGSYLWTDGIIDDVAFSPVVTTTYTVTGTDSKGCTASSTVTVVLNNDPTITAKANVNPVCEGADVILTGAGASTYSWSSSVTNGVPFQATQTQSYTVYGTDIHGCSSSASIELTVKPAPTITFTTGSDSICLGNSVTLYGHGGSSNYTWSSGITNGVSFTPTATATYTVTGTSSTGCSNTTTATITVNPLPLVVANTTSSSICDGASVTLYGSGSGSNASYKWNGGMVISDGTQFSPTSTQTYTVVGTDAHGCSAVSTVQVIVNSLPMIGYQTTGDTVCLGTSVTLNGTGAINYSWSGATSIVDGVSFIPTLGSTTFTVTGTDNNGCKDTASVAVLVNAPPVVTASAYLTELCAGVTDTLHAFGALSYTWNPGVTNGQGFLPSTGIYTVTGTDANNCSATSTVSITVNSRPMVSIYASNDSVCYGDSVILAGQGNAISYNWSSGIHDSIAFLPASGITSYTVTATAANACTATASIAIKTNSKPTVTILASNYSVCPGSTTALLGNGADNYVWSNGIQDGVPFSPTSTQTYTVTGTDASGCSSTNTITIPVSSIPIVTVDPVSPKVCKGDSILITARGAQNYVWSSQVGIHVLDQATTYVSPITKTTYTVSGTANGCSIPGSTTVTVDVNPLPLVQANASASVICTGSQVTLSGSGASNYEWSTNVQDGVAFTPLSTKTYTVIGTDSNGCKNTNTVTVSVSAPPTIGLQFSSTSICKGGTATITAWGGTTYNWNTGSTLPGITVQPLVTTTYTLGVNAQACPKDTSFQIIVSTPPTIQISPTQTICFGGTAQLSASGGSIYSWSPIVGLSNSTVSNITATPVKNTTYTLTVSDAQGCTALDSVQVIVNPLPVVNVCCATTINIGIEAPLDITGAPMGSSYNWMPGTALSCATCQQVMVSPKVNTTYSVTITDPQGCTAADSVLVTVNGDCNVFVPNAFSPNGDGSNERVGVYGDCLAQLDFQIFDRWGNRVFEGKQESETWDGTINGKPMNAGAYVYILKATTYNGREVNKQGTINLLR